MGVLREYVFRRDGGCIFRSVPTHYCRGRLHLGHVPDRGRNAYGRRAPDDERHTVAICEATNVPGETRAEREFERDYLRRVEPGYHRDA